MPAQGQLVKRTYVSSIDGAAIDYALWLPPGQGDRPDEAWPLIVFLHGSGEGKDWEAPTSINASVPVLGARSEIPFIVVFPLMRGSWSINSLAERDVLETIADVQTHFVVDPDRVHLVGLSLGGFAGWRLACRYPHLWASATLFCGGGEPDLAVNLRHVPVRVYHGARDPIVPVEQSRDMVAALRKADIPVQYIEIPEGKHNIWSDPLSGKELYGWIGLQRRVGRPRRIGFRTHTLRHQRAYWASIESMIDPAAPAFVDVFVPPGESRVFVHTENVGHLVLDPPAEFFGNAGTSPFVVNNQQVAGTQTDRGWSIRLPGGAEGERIKRRGLSGPIQDVLFDSFVVSVANPTDAERNRAWAAAADQAFDWTNRLTAGDVPMIPADQVTQELMQRSHLICIGDTTDHPLLADLVGKVPLHAEAGRVYLDGQPLAESLAAFVMIYPNPLVPDRYIVICSGRPGAVGRLAGMALTPPYLNPEPVEDVILLRRDGELLPWTDAPEVARDASPKGERLRPRGPVFDSAWRLPAAARQRLQGADSP